MVNRTNRIAIIALLAAIGCILITVGAVLYHVKSKQLKELKLNLAKSQKQVEEVRVKVAKMPQLEVTYQELNQQVSVLEPALPTEAYIPTFLSQVQMLAAKTNNHLTLIKPKPKRKLPVASRAPEQDVVSKDTGNGHPGASPEVAMVSPYDEIGIELGFDGTYLSSLKLLEELREFPKMIAINDVSIKPKSSSRTAAVGSDPLLEITFQLIAVIAKEN